MGFEKLEKKMAHLIEPFHILTITLLSLLLPLSFLLLARLSTAQFFANYFPLNPSLPQSLSSLISLLLYTNPGLIHALVSIMSLATLLHGLTGKITFLNESSSPSFRPSLCSAWIFLCTLQICVGLGIEGSIAAGIEDINPGNQGSLYSRFIFFFGLHETMLHWSRMVVRPVVDDTVFGSLREEKWVEKAVMAVSFGGLWWWRLRDEVESLVMVAEVKKELLGVGVGVGDFVGWWLYYLTVTIGMVKIVKGLFWVGMILLCKMGRRRIEANTEIFHGNEEKV